MDAWAVSFDVPQPYARLSDVQHALGALRADDAIPDTVLLLEHEPVVTLGRRGRTQHLLVSPESLAARGIAFARASRGGDVTYHGPGQLVLYPILRLGASGMDAHGYLHNLEEIAIRTCADFGVKAHRVDGKNGAWTEAGKIAAIGFNLKRWITVHGMSFNVDPDLDGFSTIVPCGLEGDPVCSLRTLLGSATPDIKEVRTSMAQHFEAVCGRTLAHYQPETVPEPVRSLLTRCI